MNKKRNGFTLVELLVVISIIALLLSVLMPALSKARQNAQRLVCATNLHNISTAMSVYHGMYNQFPAITWEPAGSTDMNLRTYWWEALIMSGAVAGKEEPRGSGNWALANEAGWKAYCCPEFLRQTKLKYTWAGQGYAYNNGYLSATYGDRLPNPTFLGKNFKGNVITLIDAGTSTTSMPFINSTVTFFPYNPKLRAWQTNGIIAIWHTIAKNISVANSAWTDGHVETRKVTEYKPIMVDPLVNIRK